MNEELERVSQILNEGIIQELRLQGHVLLEELESTIKGNVKVRNQKNITILEGFAVDYIQKMEFGVRPSELGSAANHLNALTGFYIKLGFSPKRAFVKAKRLLPHHLQEGVPTERFLPLVVDFNEPDAIQLLLDKVQHLQVDVLVNNAGR